MDEIPNVCLWLTESKRVWMASRHLFPWSDIHLPPNIHTVSGWVHCMTSNCEKAPYFHHMLCLCASYCFRNTHQQVAIMRMVLSKVEM